MKKPAKKGRPTQGHCPKKYEIEHRERRPQELPTSEPSKEKEGETEARGNREKLIPRVRIRNEQHVERGNPFPEIRPGTLRE